jgi:anti-anti-sigma regulatory factor
MATIPSGRLTTSPGPTPRSVLVGVRGALDVDTTASLQRALDGIPDGSDICAMSVDLHEVDGVDIDGVTALAVVAGRVEDRGAEVTLIDPPELLCQALETVGLTGLIRMVRQGQTLRVATRIGRRQAQKDHPAGRIHAVGGPNLVEPVSM